MEDGDGVSSGEGLSISSIAVGSGKPYIMENEKVSLKPDSGLPDAPGAHIRKNPSPGDR